MNQLYYDYVFFYIDNFIMTMSFSYIGNTFSSFSANNKIYNWILFYSKNMDWLLR